MNLISNNPLIERYRYSSLRPKQCWIYVSMFVTVIVIILAINYSILKNHPAVFESARHMCASLYYQFMAFLVFMAWVISAGTSSTAIRTEINERSYDFFRMLPLSAHQKAIGIIIGRNLLVMILAAIVAVTALFLGAFGGMSPALQIQMMIIVCAGAVFFNCAALFASINPSRKTQNKNVNSIGMLFAAVFLLPYLIGAIYSLSEVSALETLDISFFSMKIPLLLLISVIALYFAAWIYLGILRRFDKETHPVMTKPGAFFFMAGVIGITLGLTSPHLNEETHMLAYLVWGFPFLFLSVLPFGYFLNREQYMEMLVRRGGVRAIDFLMRTSNIATCIGLFIMWAVASLCVSAFAGQSALISMRHIAALFSFYMVFCLLCELNSLTISGNTKISILLVFFGVVYLIFPLIIAAIMESGIAAGYSLFGYFGLIFADALDEPVVADTRSVIVANALWIFVLAVFVKAGYKRLLSSRTQMHDA